MHLFAGLKGIFKTVEGVPKQKPCAESEVAPAGVLQPHVSL
jgi:hypothetical protein